MNKYELAVVLNPTLDEEGVKAVLTNIQELIARFGGTVEKVDEWGKRKLAYEIQKVNEGFYTFITFNAEPTAPNELEQRMRIMDNVLRYLIVSVEA